MSPANHVRQRLANRDRFSLAELRGWMTEEHDLDLWAAVYNVLGRGWDRIRPEPEMGDCCRFITRYLLRCIHEDVQQDDGEVPMGIEAAHDLAACFKLWASKLPETESVLRTAAEEVTGAYLAANAAERDRLLNGMLEHALESAAVRPFFEQWKDDPILAEPWRLAMEWTAGWPGR